MKCNNKNTPHILDQLYLLRREIIQELYENSTSDNHYTTSEELYAIDQIIFAIENKYLSEIPFYKIISRHACLTQHIGDYDFKMLSKTEDFPQKQTT